MLTPDSVLDLIYRAESQRRELSNPPRFAVGDSVRIRNLHPQTHTRLPRYCRGATGQIVACRGGYTYPDDNAVGRGADPQQLYAVEVSQKSLWGAPGRDSVVLDLWEAYLEPAAGEGAPHEG